jgi:hypothetical protein
VTNRLEQRPTAASMTGAHGDCCESIDQSHSSSSLSMAPGAGMYAAWTELRPDV